MSETSPLSKLLASELQYRWILFRFLEFCEQPKTYLSVQEMALEHLKGKVVIHQPDVFLKWLEDAGGIERIKTEDGGQWATTAAGKEILAQFGPSRLLLNLLDANPDHRLIYLHILKFSLTPRKRVEIEESLKDHPILLRDRLHPAYFIQELERSGGLEWGGGHWVTTQAGKGVLE